MTAEEKAKILAGMFQGATFQDSQIIGIAESGSTVVYKQETGNDNEAHFPLSKTKDEGVATYKFLSENNFIKVPLASWLFLMGYITEKPQTVVSIIWLTTKEQLRFMLETTFNDLITNKSIKKVDLERLVPKCFVDSDKKPIKLSKSKVEYSENMEKLKKNLPTIFRHVD